MRLALLPLLVFVACSEGGPKGSDAVDDTAPTDSGDSGPVLPESDCENGTGSISAVSIEETDMATVLRVRWTTSAETESWVAFADAEDAARVTPTQTGAGEHEALLLGLTQDDEVAWRVVEDQGGLEGCSEAGTTTTGRFEIYPPELSADVGEGAATGYLAGPVLNTDTSFVTLMNRAGEPVWSWPVPIVNPATSDAPIAPIMRVHLSRDGQSLLFNGMAISEDTDAYLYRVSLDGSDVTTLNVRGGHTDFTELPDGTLLMLGWEVQTYGVRTLVGDVIFSIQPDGTQTKVWDAFDVIPVDLSRTYEKGYYYVDRDAELWTHINSIRYDETTDALVLSMTQDSTILVLDRETFAVKWMLSETTGDFALKEGAFPGPLMSYPHSGELVGDDVLVFSRGDPYDTSVCAEAAEISLNTEAGTAEKTWRWQPDDCLIVPFLGNAERLENGDTLVNFASLGLAAEVSPEGETVVQLNSDIGAAFGFIDFLPSLYR